MGAMFSRLLGLLLILFVSSPLLAQKVSGTILDDAGAKLPNVSVTVKGTNNGTVSDDQGKFSITVETGKSLVFSHVGYGSS